MPCEFGAIVLVPFPFTDQRASKRRPAAIVSNRVYNDQNWTS
jgi:mRNA interferase MazF